MTYNDTYYNDFELDTPGAHSVQHSNYAALLR